MRMSIVKTRHHERAVQVDAFGPPAGFGEATNFRDMVACHAEAMHHLGCSRRESLAGEHMAIEVENIGVATILCRGRQGGCCEDCK